MQDVFSLLQNNPFMALFLAVAMGYFIGKLRLGQTELGGIAGTLISAVLIGQIGIHISPDVEGIFFALFIYMVGYNGGPQFFNSLNRSTFVQVVAAFVMTLAGLATVIAAAKLFDLGPGLAAGLAAGGLTQSAIIGTAGGAIDQLGLTAEVAKTYKTNVAIGYSVTYIFGSLGPILMVTAFFPLLYKWNLREEANKWAVKMGGGASQLEEGEFSPLNKIVSRIYCATGTGKTVGKTIAALEGQFGSDITVEEMARGGQLIAVKPDDVIAENDLLLVTGYTKKVEELSDYIGKERVNDDNLFDLVEEHRNLVLTNAKINGMTLHELHDKKNEMQLQGAYLSRIERMGNELPVLSGTVLNKGDELTFIGKSSDLDAISGLIGYKSPSKNATEFVTFGLGMLLGYLIGQIGVTFGTTHIAFGSGLGCLLSGLAFGWLRAKHPRFGGVNSGGANFLQSFGLAVFVGVVGLNAGETAWVAIKEHGATLFYLGIAVTLIPCFVVFYFNRYILRIKDPIIAMAVIAGGRSGNPAFSALLEKCGNAAPVAPFTVTYAIANVFLTLWGPVIIAILH
jgi:putative transport protein